MNFNKHLKAYAALMRLNRPIGIYLLLWPTLWALWIASAGRPYADILIIFVAGTIIMRSAGCVINDFADRKFDGRVARTHDRPLAVGAIKPFEALILAAILLLLAFGLALLLNWLAITLALVGVAIVAIYPFLKRFTYLPQLVLGLAMSWGTLMAFAAQTYRLPMISLLVFLISYIWVVVYDTLYAMSDREDDLVIGIKSIAIFFGRYDRLIVTLLQLLVLALLILLGYLLVFGVWFYSAVLIAAVIICYQQYLIRNHEPARCLQAFLNNHWFGLIIFAGIFLSYLP